MDAAADTTNPFALKPREAWQALRRLLGNPEETEHVFTIIRSLSGKTLLRGYNRFVATPSGRAILAEKRNLIDLLNNRDYLRAQPADSVAAHYLHYMETEDLTADGLVEASEDGELPQHEGLALYASRLRDQHDLWHVITNHGRDVRGELCLLAFTVAQTMNPGLALIVLAGMLKIGRESGDWRILKAAWEGFRNGRRAAWLPATEWEQFLALPMDTVRRQLHIGQPATYQRILRDQTANNTLQATTA
ncbi:MAG: Coq4 family protein [Pseudomonadales bacterium]